MKLIPPHRKKSSPVLAWKQIRGEAKELIRFFDEKSGKFEGKYKDAFAIHHSQVSDSPLNFFVVHKKLVKEKSFPHRVIVNPVIVKTFKDSDELTREACMSYPDTKPAKIKRFQEIEVSYEVPRFGLYLTKVEKQYKMGIVAQVFQHECDHANAVFVYDREPEKRAKKRERANAK